MKFRTVPYRYYNVIRNCGDAISAYVFREVFGLTGRVVPSQADHVLPVGSIFFMASSRSHVWGSGVLSPDMHIPQVNPALIHALRGKKTVNHLRSLGYDIPDVPLGDPGILVSEFVEAADRPKFKAAVIPHHTAFHSQRWEGARHSAEICMVDMMDDTLYPVQQIADSEVVLSQSLHGLVFAAALGKPYLWISGRSTETWNWKFQDWFTTCENPQNAPVLLDVPIDDMIEMAEPRACVCDREDLKAAFPNHLTDDTQLAFGDFDYNRRASPQRVFVNQSLTNRAEGAVIEADLLIRQVREIRRTMFHGMPEPTYLGILSLAADQIPDHEDLMCGQRYLDENREVQFVWYPAKGAAGRSKIFSREVQNLEGAGHQEGSILIRPNGNIGPASKFVIYS